MTISPEIDVPAKADLEAAVHTIDRDAIVVANAGAGKTYLLVEHYFALLETGLDPAHLVAFTFTEKAAQELKERIHARLETHPGFCDLPEELLQDWRRRLLPASIGTLHQFCLKILDAAQPAERRKAFKIVDEALEETLKAEVLRNFLREKFVAEDPDALRLLKAYGIGKFRELLFARLEMFHAEKLPSDQLPEPESAEAVLLQSLETLAIPFLKAFEQRKSALSWLSFSDMERQALIQLQKPNDSLKKFLGRMQHLLVDEFQDTSPVQIHILQALRDAKRSQGQSLRLFAVGDPKQSIYRFRDVDRHLIRRTEEEIVQGGGLRFDSALNWRSSPALLDLVNCYSATAFPEALPSQATQPEAPGTLVYLSEVSSEEEKLSAQDQSEREAERVCSAIAELLKETPAEQIAVLYRTSSAVEALVQSFQKYCIPYCVRGGQNLFERQEVLDLHRFTYFLANPEDDISLVGLLRSPLFLLSDAALYFLSRDRPGKTSLWKHLQEDSALSRLEKGRPEEVQKFLLCREELQRFLRLVPSQAPSRLLENFIRRGGFGELYALASGENQRWLAVEQWLSWLRAMEADEAPLTWTEVAHRLRETSELRPKKTPLGDSIAARGSVQLLTLHKAKGLEFDTVFLIGMNKKGKPDYPLLQRLGSEGALKWPDPEEKGMNSSARYQAIEGIHQEEDFEENKRLLYVALTRAKRRLFVLLHGGPGPKGSLQNLLKQSLGSDWEKWRGQPPASLKPPLPVVYTDPDVVEATPLKVFAPEASVSELETFQTCPLKHHFAYRLQVPQKTAQIEKSCDATEIGTLLHEILNRLHLVPEEPVAEAIGATLEFSPWRGMEELNSILFDNLSSYLKSGLYRNLAEAKEDYSELPFVLRLNEVDLRGQIDRLYRSAEGWELVDFKYSDRPTSTHELLRTYGFQLKTYALAAQRLLREPLLRIQIHVLNRAERHDFEFSPTELVAHENKLRSFLKDWGSHSDLSSIRWRPACAQCSFHREVPVCPVPQGRPFQE